jgi:amidohydrolase
MQIEDFIKIRKRLHQHPEISTKEVKTKAHIKQLMHEQWPNAQVEHAEHDSLIISRCASSTTSNHIAFRCELDALPIQETNDFKHKSLIQGASHKCGHDGHMAILIRLAFLLNQNFPSDTRISLICQSAEETGIGAQEILKHSSLLKKHPLDYIFALHNVPSYPKGSVIVKSGLFTPSVVSAKTRLIGKESHAAEPQNGVNPANAISDIISGIDQLKKDTESAYRQFIATPVYLQMGSESYGTSAGDGTVGYTFRTTDYQSLTDFKNNYQQLIQNVCDKADLTYLTGWFEEFPSVINDFDSTEKVIQSANALSYPIQQKENAFAWGEDFGAFTQKYKGAMFGLGAGEDIPNLHNPDYDFEDDLIEIGSNLFYEIIQKTIEC